jgi:hypothetical protein
MTEGLVLHDNLCLLWLLALRRPRPHQQALKCPARCWWGRDRRSVAAGLGGTKRRGDSLRIWEGLPDLESHDVLNPRDSPKFWENCPDLDPDVRAPPRFREVPPTPSPRALAQPDLPMSPIWYDIIDCTAATSSELIAQRRQL